MKHMEYIHQLARRMNHLMKWPLFGILTVLAVTLGVRAGDFTGDTYVNDAVVSYPGTETQPPLIDATNFINNSQFIINFTALISDYPTYETSDTENYINSGLMAVNSAFAFDNKSSVSGQRTPSKSFFNSGTITCGSVTDTGAQLFYGFGQCFVNASNIVNTGQIIAGDGGRIQLQGNNLDLSYGTLNIESSSSVAAGTGTFGLNTNFWDPTLFLGPNFAESAFFRISPFFLLLTNSTAYMRFDSPTASNNIIRAVFIQDTSPTNVSYNVYFGPAGFLGNGSATIEWAGGYVDSATGNSVSNYLYLNNDYVISGQTNIFYLNGIPDNFTFTSSTTPIGIGVTPTAPGFLNVFLPGSVTNNYTYANAELIASSIGTNEIVNLSPTNLPGRIEINATNELNLAYANLSGLNYMSLNSPHQFDGTLGAQIQAPYSDINLGVTNGFLTISNLMSPYVSKWSGTVQAWSTRWLTVVNGVTNDFRVLIVGSQLLPINPALIQDLNLHATNSLVISDALNILRSLKSDAQILTLTTNETGVGATSFDGELNINTGDVLWHKALPNLRYLTNNGAIRLQNLGQFIGSSNNITIMPGIPATTAHGLLSAFSTSVNLTAGNYVTIGTNRYLFVKKITNSIPNQIKLGTKLSGSLSNLIAAINRSAGAGSNYSSATIANAFVTAGTLITNRFVVTARSPGAAANLILTTNKAVNLTWNGHLTLYGGSNAVAAVTNIASGNVAYKSMVNSGLISDQGSTVTSDYFQNSGTISNWSGSFLLQSKDSLLTNGSVIAGSDISFTSSGDTIISNVFLVAGRSLTLNVVSNLSDTGPTNGNFWVIQNGSTTGGNGLIQNIHPKFGDLSGTTISNYCAGPNKQVLNVWAGTNVGVSNTGYTNNTAIGRLILTAGGFSSVFRFSGASVSNALYVDYLELDGALTNGINNSYDFTQNLAIAPNLVIYFSECVANGISIAAKVDAASRAGRNGGRLRWVPSHAGQFSSVSIVYPDGTTNTFNSALAASTTLDSNGNGIPNGTDPAPFFVGSQIIPVIGLTNIPPLTATIQWNSIPGATNYVYYTTNIVLSPQFLLTNFVSPSLVPPAGGWPITNIIYDPVNPLQNRSYTIKVAPNANLLYGP